ncbi:MAG: hypothetical protein J6W14_01080 [Clostridia bacterium]|nr:hypothetical protein [Clostridia bacterium]
MKLFQRLICMIAALILTASALVSCTPDLEAPDGMQAASLEGVEYALYVPESWVVNKNSGVSGAYVSAYDKSNVTLISYIPNTAMTAEQYWTVCEESYKTEFDNYAFVESGSVTMAGLPAPYYVYTATIGGDDYKFLQAIVGSNGIFYNLTYTATSEFYDAHIEEVMSIIEAFTFR